MPGYALKQLKKYNYTAQKKVHTPLQPLPKKYGKAAQEPLPDDTTKPLDNKEKQKFIQQVVGSFFFMDEQ